MTYEEIYKNFVPINEDIKTTIKIEKTLFGIVDPFLFSKIKTDKNGISYGSGIMLNTFETIQDLIKVFLKNPEIFKNKLVVEFQQTSSKYHFIFKRKLSNIDKYIALI